MAPCNRRAVAQLGDVAGVTVLLVERDVEVALEHSHRGYVVETGTIFPASSAAELLEDPRTWRATLGL